MQEENLFPLALFLFWKIIGLYTVSCSYGLNGIIIRTTQIQSTPNFLSFYFYNVTIPVSLFVFLGVTARIYLPCFGSSANVGLHHTIVPLGYAFSLGFKKFPP